MYFKVIADLFQNNYLGNLIRRSKFESDWLQINRFSYFIRSWQHFGRAVYNMLKHDSATFAIIIICLLRHTSGERPLSLHVTLINFQTVIIYCANEESKLLELRDLKKVFIRDISNLVANTDLTQIKILIRFEAPFYACAALAQLTISINTVSPKVSALFRLCLLHGVQGSLFYWHRLYVLRHFPFMNVMVYRFHPRQCQCFQE